MTQATIRQAEVDMASCRTILVDDSFTEHRTGQPSAVQQSFLPANILQEIPCSRGQLVSSPTLGGEILSDSANVQLRSVWKAIFIAH